MRARVQIISVLLLVFLMLSCSKEDRQDPEDIGPIEFIESLPGGCNGVEFGQIKSLMEGPDTVSFDLTNDTLDVFVGINYICCAPFDTETSISGDSIFITVKDTCPYPYACYCYCMCYYTWEFLFTGIEEKAYYYRVMLESPLDGYPEIFREGTIQ